jgi:hypothetical protein
MNGLLGQKAGFNSHGMITKQSRSKTRRDLQRNPLWMTRMSQMDHHLDQMQEDIRIHDHRDRPARLIPQTRQHLRTHQRKQGEVQRLLTPPPIHDLDGSIRESKRNSRYHVQVFGKNDWD